MPYSPTTWVEKVTTLGPTNMNKIEQGLALTSPAYGTTLPGSPADGQEAILVDSVTVSTYSWRFRYNASASSSFKWEFIGGSPAYQLVATQEGTTTTGSWLDLTTLGPQIAVSNAGDYHVWSNAETTHSAVSGQLFFGIAVNGGTPALAVQRTNSSATPMGIFGMPLQSRLTGLAAGDFARMRYFNNTAGTATYANRMLSVLPIRVS